MPELTKRDRKNFDDEAFGEDIDGLPDLEGEEVVGDDDDGGVRLMNIERAGPDEDMVPPGPPPSRARRAPPRKRKPSPTSKIEEQIEEDFADILTGLEFGEGTMKINVTREAPTYDPDTGKKISGLLDTFRQPIEVEDIQKRFGGGTYVITVHGRDPNTNRSGIRARKRIEIAGAPIPLPDPREEARRKKDEEGREGNLISGLMEQQERARERAEQMMAELRKENAAKDKTMLEMVAKLGENKGDPGAALAAAMSPLFQSMQEQQARMEQQRIEDRRREEEARKEERERQRQREEERQRQWELQQKESERRFELQMAQLKADQARAEAQAKAQAEAERNNMQFMLQFMTKTDAEKEARSREATQMQLQMFQQLNEQNSKFSEAQIKMLQSQISNKDDMIGTIEKLAIVRDFFNPQETDDRATWEKVADRVGEALPAIVPGLAAIGSRGRAPAQLPEHQPQEQVQQGPPRPAPGTVVVVDDIEAAKAQYGQLNSAPQPAPEVAASHQPDGPAQENDMNQANAETPVNDLTEFPDEYPSNPQQGLTLLVQALDLGFQKELEFEDLYAKTAAKLPAMLKMFLKSVDADTMVKFIEENVPATWAIRSLDAESQIRALHAKLVSAG